MSDKKLWCDDDLLHCRLSGRFLGPLLPPGNLFQALGALLARHQRRSESESLEKENAALRKEVKQLTEEAKFLSSVLSSHEPQCAGLAPTSPDLPYPPHRHHRHHAGYHQHIAVPHYQH
ncbi:basic leucine zipper transcriptional factor ATF-like isoform X2 [Hippocampus zosterae]|uniref:basic leucine zipper transcriptional factor ATF-like isoform X2 n=1 Tax=Hippocampus zosterae TaxID=109293 RepID=UPI00223D8455|nr:basic leucine zipper transcriptional factor ATF-like isoform X2 [Hippocampus zosterae]